jgi:hypothetical protein
VKAVEIELFSGPITSASADTFVVLVPSNERPLRGSAGELDWRICGEISAQLAGGSLGGTAHEAVLVPAPPPLAASRMLLLGLGLIETLPGRGVQEAFREVCARLLGLRSERAVLALPASLDLVRDAERALRGCLQTLSSHRGDATLTLAVPDTRPLGSALVRATELVMEESRRRRVQIIVGRAPTAAPRSGIEGHA